jgi:hypothetical protein
MTPKEMAIWRDGWAQGQRDLKRTFRHDLGPWVTLRRKVRRLADTPAMNAGERAAYRCVLRLMSKPKAGEEQ